MGDGEHEAVVTARSWWARAWAQVKYRAKAFMAGLGTFLLSEAAVLLADATFQEQIKALVPEPYAFLVPVALGLLVGVLTHQVPNGPDPSDG